MSTSIRIFRRELRALDVAVPLVAPRYGGGDEGDDDAVVRVDGFRVPFDPEDRFVPAGRMVAAARALAFDLVHVQTPFSAHTAGRRLARTRGVPLVETWHTDFEHYFEHYLPFVPAPPARWLARGIARRVGRAVDRLIVPTAEVGVALAACGVATPCTVVPTGLASGELGPGDGARFRRAHGIALDRPVAVHVGRIAGEKNLDFLLRAADLVRREVPGFLLVVAGEGPARAALERRAEELGLGPHLLWIGYLDRARELADAYCAGDLFAFSSLTETQGLVLLEAMSLGVPVVALAERGTRGLLAAGRGALVPEPDEAAFAAAMTTLLGDAALRVSLRRGADRGRRMGADRFARRLVGVYEELLAAPLRRAAPEAGRHAAVMPRG
ncbi:MAG: glycosyltransferase [Thermoanaerobaculia bacterium]